MLTPTEVFFTLSPFSVGLIATIGVLAVVGLGTLIRLVFKLLRSPKRGANPPPPASAPSHE